MATTSFTLSVSHSQIAVFDGRLEQPFNMWTDKHVNQGFAWRPGSVSFGTIADGRHFVEVVVAAESVELSPEAVRIIQVPFKVPSGGKIEVASIVESFSIELPPGMYALRYEYFERTRRSDPSVRVIFIRNNSQIFDVLRADAELCLTGELLLSASPA